MQAQNRKNYLEMIENSCGSRMFRNLYLQDKNGFIFDAVEKGNLGCGFYVSAVLKIFDKIGGLHATVSGTEKDLLENGWKEIVPGKWPDDLAKGDILVWEKSVIGDGNGHEHIGFFIGEEWAISNSSENGFPIKHHYQFGGGRRITKVLRAKWL